MTSKTLTFEVTPFNVELLFVLVEGALDTRNTTGVCRDCRCRIYGPASLLEVVVDPVGCSRRLVDVKADVRSYHVATMEIGKDSSYQSRVLEVDLWRQLLVYCLFGCKVITGISITQILGRGQH